MCSPEQGYYQSNIKPMNDNIKHALNTCGLPNENLIELYEGDLPGINLEYLDNFAKNIIIDCIKQIQLKMTRNGPNTPENVRSKLLVRTLLDFYGIKPEAIKYPLNDIERIL